MGQPQLYMHHALHCNSCPRPYILLIVSVISIIMNAQAAEASGLAMTSDIVIIISIIIIAQHSRYAFPVQHR